MTIKNNNSDILFPIENWKDAWPFAKIWVVMIVLNLYASHRREIPEYNSFLEMIVDLAGLDYVDLGSLDYDDTFQLPYQDIIEIAPEDINKNLKQEGYDEYFLENGKFYFTGYPSPIDQQLHNYWKIQPFRIDHLNYITILVLAMKLYIKENIKDSTGLCSNYIIYYLSNKKTSSQLKDYIKNLAGLDKKLLKQAFIKKLKKNFSNSTDNSTHCISDIIPDKECLQNILFCLDLDTDLVLQLSNNCTKCIEMVDYLENIDTD